MYVKISNPRIDIYDAKTKQYMGTSTLDLPSVEEKKLLDFVNFGAAPSSLLILNANLYNAPSDYVAPTINESLERIGVFRALFTDEAGKVTPVEIRMRFNSRARGVVPGDPYYLSSVLYSDIVVESLNIGVSGSLSEEGRPS